VVVVRRGRRAGDQMSPFGYWRNRGLDVGLRVQSGVRYGCHLGLMLASGGLLVNGERPVREWLVDRGHDRKGIKIRVRRKRKGMKRG
jgi:hypothetical protein